MFLTHGIVFSLNSYAIHYAMWHFRTMVPVGNGCGASGRQSTRDDPERGNQPERNRLVMDKVNVFRIRPRMVEWP